MDAELKNKSRKAAGVLFLLNGVLATAKTVAWVLSGSLAVQSEALNSIVDTVYSGLVFGGLLLATQDPTQKYPDGFRRVESFISLFIAVGVVSTAGGLAWTAVVNATDETSTLVVSQSPIAIIVLLGTAFVKIWMYRYCLSRGKMAESPALLATATENRNDVLTAVAALVGVVGSVAGIEILDALAAFVVAITIGYTGFDIAHENIGYILARAPPEEQQKQIVDAASSHPEVYGVHDIHIHYDGPQIEASLHIEVEGELTVEQAHNIEVDVVKRIRNVGKNEIGEINIHVDPNSLDEWESEL